MGYTCRQKLARAHHRAGHVCMSFLLGQRVESSLPHPTFTTPGIMVCAAGRWWSGSGDLSASQIEARVMIGLAGPLAESRFVELSQGGGDMPPTTDDAMREETAGLGELLSVNLDERAI